MNVLVLGGFGFIGRCVAEALQASGWAHPICGSRHQKAGAPGPQSINVDTRDLVGLTAALEGMDAVVNCVSGDKASIAGGARCLVEAASRARCRRIVHLSSMSVYGGVEGVVTEDALLDSTTGWYARAKCEAEGHMLGFAGQGGEVVILRPGCVTGPGSKLWVGRIGHWLSAGRIGDLGPGGDGWSNLVHVDDVCQAILMALRLPVHGDRPAKFNLAAPDSPRWNDYFTDFALASHATPLRRLSARHLRMDACVAGPPLKVAERLLGKLGRRTSTLPDALTPALLRLWAQEIRLDASAATRELRLGWTSYGDALDASVAWFCSSGR